MAEPTVLKSKSSYKWKVLFIVGAVAFAGGFFYSKSQNTLKKQQKIEIQKQTEIQIQKTKDQIKEDLKTKTVRLEKKWTVIQKPIQTKKVSHSTETTPQRVKSPKKVNSKKLAFKKAETKKPVEKVKKISAPTEIAQNEEQDQLSQNLQMQGVYLMFRRNFKLASRVELKMDTQISQAKKQIVKEKVIKTVQAAPAVVKKPVQPKAVLIEKKKKPVSRKKLELPKKEVVQLDQIKKTFHQAKAVHLSTQKKQSRFVIGRQDLIPITKEIYSYERWLLSGRRSDPPDRIKQQFPVKEEKLKGVLRPKQGLLKFPKVAVKTEVVLDTRVDAHVGIQMDTQIPKITEIKDEYPTVSLSEYPIPLPKADEKEEIHSLENSVQKDNALQNAVLQSIDNVSQFSISESSESNLVEKDAAEEKGVDLSLQEKSPLDENTLLEKPLLAVEEVEKAVKVVEYNTEPVKIATLKVSEPEVKKETLAVTTTKPVVQVATVTEPKQEQSSVQLPNTSTFTKTVNELEDRLQIVDAYNQDEQVNGSYFTVLSHEGMAAENHSKWLKAEAFESIPTLSFSNPKEEVKIPLLSQGDLNMLEILSKTKLHPDLGIVFGEIEPGWKVEISGRAEKVIYLDDQMRHVPTVKEAKHFIYMNVEPGMQLILPSLPEASLESAGIAVPVIAGVASYVQVTRPEEISFKARVLSASTDQEWGLSDTQVEPVGASNHIQVTQALGDFEIKNLIHFGDYPLYFETNRIHEHKHRYKVDPKNLVNLMFFRFDAVSVEDWSDQLSGGISLNSGMLVGAPQVLKNKFDLNLYPLVEDFNQVSDLEPETYTIDADGRLMVQQPIEVHQPRFAAFQLPDGLILIQVRDQNNEVIYSQLEASSAKVLNVLGP